MCNRCRCIAQARQEQEAALAKSEVPDYAPCRCILLCVTGWFSEQPRQSTSLVTRHGHPTAYISTQCAIRTCCYPFVAGGAADRSTHKNKPRWRAHPTTKVQQQNGWCLIRASLKLLVGIGVGAMSSPIAPQGRLPLIPDAVTPLSVELIIERHGDELRIRPAKRRMGDVLGKLAKFSPDFMERGRVENIEGDREDL